LLAESGTVRREDSHQGDPQTEGLPVGAAEVFGHLFVNAVWRDRRKRTSDPDRCRDRFAVHGGARWVDESGFGCTGSGVFENLERRLGGAAKILSGVVE